MRKTNKTPCQTYVRLELATFHRLAPELAGGLCDAYVLDVEVPFRQKPEALGVLAVLAYGNALVLRINRDNRSHLFAN